MMSVKKQPAFKFSLCVNCGICVQACPVSCIELCRRAGKGDTNLYPALTGDCLGCGSCQRACPMGAVSMEEQL